MFTKIFVLSAAFFTLVSDSTQFEESRVVTINCDTVYENIAETDSMLADDQVPKEIANLETARLKGEFDQNASEKLLQYKIILINLNARKAILEHGEYMCSIQNMT